VKLFRRRQENVLAASPEPALPSALSLVLTSGAAGLDADALARSWQAVWAGLAAPTEVVAADGSLTGEVADSTFTVSFMPSPIPVGDLEPLADRSPLWPDPRETIATHDGHAVVFAAAETPLAACLAATRVTGAVLDATRGHGVYWGAAPHLVRADVFRGLATAGSDSEPPVLLWVRIGANSEEDGTASVRTTGMDQLGLMEVEALHARMPAEELHRIVTGVVEYLAVHGPVIADGDTIGGTQADRIAVSHRASGLEPSEQVYALLVD
jgi:hypothetical protein